MLRQQFAGGVFFGLIAALQAAAGMPEPFVVLATGDQAPEFNPGVTMSAAINPPLIEPPRVNGAGQVSFLIHVTGPGIGSSNDLVIYAGPPESPMVVTREGSAAPGIGASITSLREHVFGDSGAVGVPVLTAAGFAILVGPPGGLNAVTWAGQPLPGLAGTNWQSFAGGAMVLNGQGIAAFNGTSSGGIAEPGVFAGAVGSDLATVLLRGFDAPGLPGVEFKDFIGNSTNAPLVINDSGTVFFTRDLQGAGVNSINDQSLWIGPPGGLELLAREGDAIDDIPGYQYIELEDTLFSSIDADGNALFNAKMWGPGVSTANDVAYFRGTPGNISLVVREGQGMPDGFPGGAVIGGINSVQANSSGVHAMHLLAATNAGLGINIGNNDALFVGTPGDYHMVFREGFQAPGMAAGINTGRPESVFMNSDGRVFTWAYIGGPGVTGSNNQLFYVIEPDGSATPVFRTGGQVEVARGEMRTINMARILNNALPLSNGEDGRATCFSDTGRIALHVLFAEGGSAIITVDAPPPPGPCADIDGGGTVDFPDLNELLDQWGTAGPEGDVDNSGAVDFVDLNILLDQWGTTCP